MQDITVKCVDFWPKAFIEPEFDGGVFGSDQPHKVLLNLLQSELGVELSDNPDVVLCSVFDANQEALIYDCPRIFWTGENKKPNYNIYDYSIDFCHSGPSGRHLRWPLYALYTNSFALALQKHLLVSRGGYSNAGVFAQWLYQIFGSARPTNGVLSFIKRYPRTKRSYRGEGLLTIVFGSLTGLCLTNNHFEILNANMLLLRTNTNS